MAPNTLSIADLANLDVDRIWSDARRIMAEIGLQVASPKAKQALTGKLPSKDDWFRIPPGVAEHYADEIRRKFGGPDTSAPTGKLTIFNTSLAPFCLDPADGRVKPYDTATVIRNTKLTLQLADEGHMSSAAAGVPQDVPPEMQFLTVHYINCVHLRKPWAWNLITSRAVMPYFLEIADVMGLQQSIGTEMISPLKFMGNSVDLALEHEDLPISTDPMPILGVTAPMDWHLAWAQSVAENLGSYILFRECGRENIGAPSFRLFLMNPAAATAYFSAPQHFAALLARRKVRRFFGLGGNWAEALLVTAKAPDAQAAAEKLTGCLLGRLCGFEFLEGAGALWMDEIFSPQQLLIDIELKHLAEAVGADFHEPPQDAVAVMNEGVRAGTFLMADETLARFRDFAWDPKLFDLRPRGAWDGDHTTLLRKAARIAREKAELYTYQLTGEKRERLDRIMARARKEFACA